MRKRKPRRDAIAVGAKSHAGQSKMRPRGNRPYSTGRPYAATAYLTNNGVSHESLCF